VAVDDGEVIVGEVGVVDGEVDVVGDGSPQLTINIPVRRITSKVKCNAFSYQLTSIKSEKFMFV
jgi:hypothetical protein